jgi:hypothetical protein
VSFPGHGSTNDRARVFRLATARAAFLLSGVKDANALRPVRESEIAGATTLGVPSSPLEGMVPTFAEDAIRGPYRVGRTRRQDRVKKSRTGTARLALRTPSPDVCALCCADAFDRHPPR